MRNGAIKVAIGVDSTGFRQILCVAEGDKVDNSGWLGFLRLAGFSPLAEKTRAKRCPPFNFRLLSRTDRSTFRVVSSKPLDALYRTYVPKWVQCGTE